MEATGVGLSLERSCNCRVDRLQRLAAIISAEHGERRSGGGEDIETRQGDGKRSAERDVGRLWIAAELGVIDFALLEEGGDLLLVPVPIDIDAGDVELVRHMSGAELGEVLGFLHTGPAPGRP